MFGLFRANKAQKLKKRYHVLLEQAMEAQRSGNIRLYSELSEQADGVMKELQEAEKSEAEKA